MRVRLLGALEVLDDDGAPVAVAGTRVRALLALLALRPGRLVPADRLVDALWEDDPPANAANALQTLVKRLRAALGRPGAVVWRDGGYVLDVEPGQVDAHVFTALTLSYATGALPDRMADGEVPGAELDDACAELDEALALWRGPALADLRAVAYLAAAAARLEERRLAVVEARAAAYLALGREVDLSAEVAAHPLRERLSALAMRSFARSGRQAAALALYERVRRALADELGVDPGPELRAAHLDVLRGRETTPAYERPARTPDAPGTSGTGTSGTPGGSVDGAGRRAGRVWAPPTTFVGREEEVTHLAALLRESRLVTIVGAGGAGKTRLAVETALRASGDAAAANRVAGESAARDSAARESATGEGAAGEDGDDAGGSRSYGESGHGEGAWLAELAPLTDPADVVRSVLDALGADAEPRVGGDWRRDPPDPAELLVASLAGREVLLILDNCEHVIDAAAGLAELVLRRCPGVRVLATSREPLGVPGEMLAPIPPLGLPPEGVTSVTPREAGEYPAVRLLVDRARAVSPGFALDDHTTPHVVTICRRLDGMPLAIELAAARIRALGPERLAARLDDRFRLLTGGSRTALPRHRTLSAVVEWSWDLLTPEERTLAERLAVFAGGATLDDAEPVCGGDGLDVVAVLPSLVDKSLLETPGDGRFRMLETLRAYALRRLTDSGELDRYRRRHAAHFLRLAEEAEPRLRGAGQLEWMARLTAEQDNLNAALRWAVDFREAETALRLCGTLSWYWWLRGHRGQAAAWAGQVLELVPEGPPAGLVRAYAGCRFAVTVTRLGAIWTEPAWVEEIRRELGDLIDEALREGPVHPMLPILRAVVTAMAGRREEAAAMLDAYAGSGDPWLAGSALMIRGGSLGMPGGSEQDVAEAVRRFRTLGERWGLSEALLTLATLRARRGAPTADLIDEIAGLTAGWASPDDTISTLTRLAELRLLAGDAEGAAADVAAARSHVSSRVSPYALVQVSMGEAKVARSRGDLDAAVAAYEEVLAVLEAHPAVPQQLASAYAEYGRTLLARGDLDGALARHHEALCALGTAPDPPVLATVLAGLAMIALTGGDATRSATLFGAADAAHQGWRADAEAAEAVTTAREAAGLDFDAAYERGRASPREDLGLPATGSSR
ncbi:AfsR/SARP family transcriptional regulator [Microbispora bryophytorum]|uniref:AfsR/SARP family transcriptional regulator n=1 Tax=Microbispora bryophytorum TaxID=1460882 RepID=UPI001159FC57|nr:BTAD domain-containing putative transcriptional regulator [Microbispora bryophytorum]MBD3141157.1 winged helix-turn-helix domain-containing protein [Microbispora bryophytorum]TQR99876.1 AfsR/SARP family transcriptional regulator [Microbispora bryophytorum]